jgi:hypothetical protein
VLTISLDIPPTKGSRSMKLIFLLLDAISGYNSVNVTHKKGDIPGIRLLRKPAAFNSFAYFPI